MSLSRLLDETISEPPPPFRSVDGLIARERHRRRVRRIGAALGGCAAVVAIALGAQLIGGPAATPSLPGGPGSTVTATPPSPGEDPAQRLAGISALLQTRVSAAVPGATFVVFDQTLPTLFAPSDAYYRDYEVVGAMGTVEVPGQNKGTLTRVLVFRPLVTGLPRPAGPLQHIFGGCAAVAPAFLPAGPGDVCQEFDGPDGSTVTAVERVLDGLIEIDAVVAFPDGSAVVAYAYVSEAYRVLSRDQVVSIVADRGYVAGASPDPSRTALPYLPDDPVIGTVYAHDIFSHCRYDLIPIAGGTWRAQEPFDHDLSVGGIPGTVELLDADTARFVIDQEFVDSDPDVIIYERTDEEIAPCM